MFKDGFRAAVIAPIFTITLCSCVEFIEPGEPLMPPDAVSLLEDDFESDALLSVWTRGVDNPGASLELSSDQ
ncbi:MAG: hypothetical protein AAF449_18675, partial [Myxococcota bacterium]